MKKKRIISMALTAVMALSMAGCGGLAAGPDPEPSGSSEPAKPSVSVVVPDEPEISAATDVNPHCFEDSLMDYIDNGSDLAGGSYMISPASFRAALCLAIEGAGGYTKSGLLEAARFESEQDMQRWYEDLLKDQAEFRERVSQLEADTGAYRPDGDVSNDTGMAFDIANAVWDNTDFLGGFRDTYADAVAKKYGAVARSSDSDSITSDVDSWCDEQTHGMIKSISNDLSMASGVLANALYIKSGWLDEFPDTATEKGDFIKSDGSALETSFMHRTGEYYYLKDYNDREHALFGLEGNLWLTVCLDPGADIQDMLYAQYNSSYENLDVSMPKLDLETTAGGDILCGYLAANGAGQALGDDADFSAMTDSGAGWHIGDAIQKTRLKTDEQGMEAAAVTALVMFDNAMPMEPEPPIEFHMDKPFSFLITYGRNTSDSSGNILFFGRYMG